MAYTPDPTNTAQPTAEIKASTAAAEFRSLKTYLQGLVLGAVSQGPGTRQVALIGSQDANGDPNFLSAGTGLAVNLAALNAPLCLTYAAGSTAAGDLNYSEALSADVVGVVSALAPSNLSYITKLYGGAWGSTLAPCQYGKAFDKAAQVLIRWPGANNTVVTTEDFGSVVTFVDNAKLSTAVQILGLNTIVCDGTGDQVSMPNITLGNGSWEVFGSFRTTSLAVFQYLLVLDSSGNLCGIRLAISIAGKMTLGISSNNSSQDIIADVAGAATIAINTTYFYRITYDSVGGTYRLYLSLNGAAETQDITATSALRITTTTKLTLGGRSDSTAQGFVGNIGYHGIRRWASFTSAQAVGPTVAPTFADVRTDWFSIPQMKMYQVTAASTVAGTNPTMEAVNRLHPVELTTSAVAVTSVTHYAYKGNYDMPAVAIPANGVQVIATHNIGVPSTYIRSEMGFLCATADSGKVTVPGDYTRIDPIDNGVSAGSGVFTGRLSTILNGIYGSLAPGSKGAGTRSGFIIANWRVAGNFKRTF